MMHIISLDAFVSVTERHREDNVSHACKRSEDHLPLGYIAGRCEVEIYIPNQQSQDALAKSDLPVVTLGNCGLDGDRFEQDRSNRL